MELWTALILGLVGSLHCAGMCGPLALALPPAGKTAFACLVGRLAYHLGRILTYALLGILFGILGRTLFLAGIQRWVSIALGVALLAGLIASRKRVWWRPVNRLVDTLQGRMSSLLRQRSILSLITLGLLNGLLPCGLVYVAGTAATATGGLLSSVTYMAAFGLGTLPLMLAISLSGRLIPVPLRLKLARLIPVSVFLVASLLILRGLSLGIPFLSPILNAGGASCCAP